MKRALAIMLFLSLNASAQVILKGKIKSTDSSAVAGANIMLKGSNGGIISFGRSNEQGLYNFKSKVSSGVFEIEVTRLGFQKAQNTIVLDHLENQKTIEIDFVLFENAIELEDVAIQAKRKPIIVKKDTIIYHVASFSNAFDQSLEDVLKKFPGVIIRPDGSIQVNGKEVKKVIIDGKEISDNGAAMITRNLTADKVDNVEIRFDEKDKKLKESLLDENKFVVLDIKLKSNVKKSFFGTADAGLGFAPKPEPVVYANAFSLNKKINIQTFGELSQTGNPKIDIMFIKNLGQEATQKMMAIPSDLNDIKENGALDKEIYGFRNFVKTDNAVFGTTANIPLSASADIYIGTFNSYDYFQKKNYTSQTYFAETISDFKLLNQHSRYFSKNKIELKYTVDHLKSNTNLNYVFTKINKNINGLNSTSNENIDFNNQNQSNNFYLNHFTEYLFNDKWAMSTKAAYTRENTPIFTEAFIKNLGNIPFNQHNKNLESNFLYELSAHHNGNILNQNLGYKFWNDKLENTKKSNYSDFENPIQTSDFKINTLFYKLDFHLGSIYFSSNHDFSNLNYTAQINQKNTKNGYYFDHNINYTLDNNHTFSLALSKKLDKIPLHKIMQGYILKDFQNVILPTTEIRPTHINQLMLTYNFTGSQRIFETVAAFLHSKVQNVDNIGFGNNIIQKLSAQNDGEFSLLSLQFKRNKTENFSFNIGLKPEGIFQKSTYKFNEMPLKNATDIKSLELDFWSDSKKTSNFKLLSKFTDIEFRSSGEVQNMTFLSNSFSLFQTSFKEKLLWNGSFRLVNFWNSSVKNFNQFDLEITYKRPKSNIKISALNLLDSKIFLTQDLNNNLLYINENSVLGRYITLTYGFRF